MMSKRALDSTRGEYEERAKEKKEKEGREGEDQAKMIGK
jgi:hypothetical protein